LGFGSTDIGPGKPVSGVEFNCFLDIGRAIDRIIIKGMLIISPEIFKMSLN
jgi:hypothetical protein